MIIYYMVITILSYLYPYLVGANGILTTYCRYNMNTIPLFVFRIVYPIIFGILILLTVKQMQKMQFKQTLVINTIFIIINIVIYICCFQYLWEFATYTTILIAILLTDIIAKLISHKHK